MLFTFFKRDYIVRRFGKETVEEGFSAAPYEDSVLKLEDFQPLSADEIQALPEGQRSIRRIKSIGTTQFTPADEKTGVRGDWVYYEGRWFECSSCHKWDHTILAHYESEFVEVPPGLDTKPPELEVGA